MGEREKLKTETEDGVVGDNEAKVAGRRETRKGGEPFLIP